MVVGWGLGLRLGLVVGGQIRYFFFLSKKSLFIKCYQAIGLEGHVY